MAPVRVDVAMLSLGAHEAAGVVALAQWLDGPECARAASFASPLDSQLFVAAHVLARMQLCAVGGRAPWQWSFDIGHGGKPRVRDEAGGPVPAFSLAHARSVSGGPVCGLVGVAALRGAGCDVGFDLEAHDPTLVAEDFTRVLTPHEAATLRALPAEHRPAALARLWCLKEAFVKATGEGLAADLSQIGVDARGHAVRLNAPPAATDGPWHFEHRAQPDGSHAALAVRCPPATTVNVRWRRWSVARLARWLHAYAQRPHPHADAQRPHPDPYAQRPPPFPTGG